MAAILKVPKISLFSKTRSKEVIRKIQKRGLNDMLLTFQRNIKTEAPKGATADLKNNIFTENFTTHGKVFATAPYANVIEKGRRAAPVAQEADIEGWIRRSTSGRAYQAALRAKFPKITLKGMEFLLRRSLKRKKREPNPFFERGIEKSTARINKIQKEIEIDLKVQLQK